MTKHKDMGYVEDRLVSPFVIYEHLPTQTKYVDFPFANNPSILFSGSPANPSLADYQQKRFYSDEVPMKLEDFNKLRND